MVLAFVFGLALIWIDGTQPAGLGLPARALDDGQAGRGGLPVAWHGFLAGARQRIAAGERPRTAKFWRATNELPFLAAIVMVLAVPLEFKFR